MKKSPQPGELASLLRRQFIRKTGGYLLASPFLGLAACGGSTESESLSSTTETSEDTGTDTSSGNTTLTEDYSEVDWATGGTEAMTLEYPNPFDLGYGSTCNLTSETTEGPCYSNTLTREDISDGLAGLPTRLCFRVLDGNCNPVEGVVVDIWHCDPAGVYSGDSMDSVNFCTGGDTYYTSNDFFRGTQTTDSEGIVWFDSCFPGWYSSRAIHIHFKLIINNSTQVISQVGFADTLVDDILTSQSDYSARGEPDTHNTDDTVFPSSGFEEYLMDTFKMSDGSLLAWKQLRVS
jgi:protocatechuate 3,4-dioxygenase beta subunit